MTETDTYYLILGMRDELMAQNKKLDKKLDKIAELLEAQTKLQEGIFKQLYLLCQIEAAPSEMMKGSFGRDSLKVFAETPIPGEIPDEN